MAPETQVHQLKVADYMTKNPITIASSAMLSEAIVVMTSKRIGNLVIVTENGNNTVEGIFTERDILRYLSLEKEIPNKSIIFVPLELFSKITPTDTVYTAAKLMISNTTRLLVFEDDNNKSEKIAGIITASDIVRAFRKTDSNPSIEDVMNRKIFDIEYDNSIPVAIKMLYEKGIGSIIVNKNEKPYGIFTERDLLTKVLSKGLKLEEEKKVGDFCSSPLITAQRSIRANKAANIMFANNIKRLPLTENNNIVSMITARDLVEAFQKD
jgi:CBS domain-containing protein